MLLAPLIGLVLAVMTGVVLAVIVALTETAAGHLLAAVAAIGVLAYLTRGLHLDGLADLADGLGAGRDPARSLAVMHQSDIGPFGVMTVVVILLLQVAALAHLTAQGAATLGLLVAVPAGRLSLALLCRPGVPAAPGSRLGAWVAGRVSTTGAAAATVAWTVLAALCGWGLGSAGTGVAAAAAVLAAVGVGLILGRTARQRLGGITGDVLGAAVECAQTAALLLLALSLG